jgi:hypothetical protein
LPPQHPPSAFSTESGVGPEISEAVPAKALQPQPLSPFGFAKDSRGSPCSTFLFPPQHALLE